MPEYIIKENPELIPLPSKCPTNAVERKYFEITRTRNLNSCEKRAQFNFFKPWRSDCSLPDASKCDFLPSRMSVTRFFMCASISALPSGSTSSAGISKALRASNVVLQRIVNEEEQNVNLMGYNTERFVTGTKQVLMLQSIKDATSFPNVSHPMKLFDLMHEYDTKILPPFSNGNRFSVNLKNGRLNNAAEIVSELLPNKIFSKVNPRAVMLDFDGLNSSSTNLLEIIKQIKTLLKEATAELMQNEKLERSRKNNQENLNMRLLGITRGFSTFNDRRQFVQLWNNLFGVSETTDQHQEAMKNFFVDTVAMAGTPASVDFLLKLIKENKMTHTQILNFFIWMPQNIVYPSQKLLENIFQTIKSEKIKDYTMLYNTAIPSFTQVL